MNKSNLRVVDNERPHARDTARQAVKRHKNLHKGLCTAHDESRAVHAPTMNIDAVHDRTTSMQMGHIGKK